MSAVVRVSFEIYSLDTVLRACHAFTGRCSVFVRHIDNAVEIELQPREPAGDLEGAFANALLDAHLRATIAAETRVIRELLVAQAFCEGDLLDHGDSEADEYDDPRGIAATRESSR